ncbi:hypothetical protein Smic_57240 [Streptomyces microflavus]|uniref:Uncharacterized protein n=1 Tax=Streptomyces microflavus TaxID=1919 RepID=A0A7J0CXQ4_STRMI|nr:hypothetical protein Smic_57240 [Streptomyces microflavus]
MRLDVGVFGAEEGGGAAYGDALGGVRVLAAAVVAGARVPLGVLVGERGAEGGQDRGRGEVLGGDQLEGGGLPVPLRDQDPGDLRVLAEQRAEVLGEVVRRGRRGCGCGGRGDRHGTAPGLGGARVTTVGRQSVDRPLTGVVSSAACALTSRATRQTGFARGAQP